jgi:hypothetical protein
MTPTPESWRATLAALDAEMTEQLHGLGNSLNQILLQAAVLQLKSPEPLKAELASLRGQGTTITAQLRALQATRDRLRRLYEQGTG